MAWVYILECSDGSFYVGSTKDLDRRVWQHENGEGAAYTKRRRPVRLVWCLAFERVDEAWAFEKRIQTWGRAKRIALIEGRVEDLPMLASRSHTAIRRRQGGSLGLVTGAERPPRPADAQQEGPSVS